jgi:beta-phosphoglucomutase-like phosphatase (HAD superfamily)
VPFGAVIFDFNGTLSDDEPILYAVYAEMFAEHGRPLKEREYYERAAAADDGVARRREPGGAGARLRVLRKRNPNSVLRNLSGSAGMVSLTASLLPQPPAVAVAPNSRQPRRVAAAGHLQPVMLFDPC